MNRMFTSIAVLTLCAGCATTGNVPNYNYQTTSNQVVQNVDGVDSVYSMNDDSFVTLSPRYEKLSDHQGAMFVVAAFNQSDRPLPFGPSSIHVTDGSGRPLRLLDSKRVDEIEHDRQRGKRLLSGVLATATTLAATYVAGEYIADQQAAGFNTAQLQYDLTNAVVGISQGAFSAANLYNTNLDKAAKSQIKHFKSKALRPTQLSKNETGGGFFIVDGKPESMIITIMADREQHVFRISRQQ
jgi:hypothetical protein